MNALRVKDIVVCGLLTALILTPLASAAAFAQNPLEVIPEDCVACIRINNFQYTISQMDQFLVGLSPMPLGLTAIIQGMLGGILGDPLLGGVNMNGTVGGFILATPGETEPDKQMFGAILVPVADYDAFLACPNVGQPDAAGVSQIVPKNMIPPMPPVAVKKVGSFALVTWVDSADKLATVAASMSSPTSKSVATLGEVAASDISNAPVWMYLDLAKAAELAPAAGGQMPPGTMPGMPTLGTPGTANAPADFGAMPMMPFDLTSMAGDSPVKSLILGLDPKPNSLIVMTRLSAVPGGELEPVFTRGSAQMQELFAAVGAKTPAQMGSEMAAVSALLPNASAADAVGTYDLLQIAALADAMPVPIPVEFPEPSAPSKSAVAYAVTADRGKLAADIAFPKEHVIEVVDYVKKVVSEGLPAEMPGGMTAEDTDTLVMQGGLGGLFGDDAGDVDITFPQDSQNEIAMAETDEPQDEISMITASPFGNLPSTPHTPTTRVVPSDTLFPSDTIAIEPKDTTMPSIGPGTGLFGDTDTTFTDTAAAVGPAPSGAAKVRVAGVRLVRYSDLNLGVLPLGRGDGYTLSLIADLPAPAAKIAGGVVKRAVTNDGKDLAPQNEWDCQIRLARLSKDYKTAVFDIELLLPDPGAMGIEELTGSLDYFTASGTKNVDLGLLEMKPGTQASQLGARISSIDLSPFRTSGPIVALTLNVPADAVESVELYDEQDKRIEIVRYGSVSFGRTSTLKFIVEDELPARARILVHLFEGLQKHNLPFTIRAISLAGLPMR